VVGSPGGQSKECFSRNFRPSSESLISCSSSIIGASPPLRVLGLKAVPGTGEFLLVSAATLFLLTVVGGIWVRYIEGIDAGCRKWLYLWMLRWLGTVCYAF
jgi:hypothetical protein